MPMAGKLELDDVYSPFEPKLLHDYAKTSMQETTFPQDNLVGQHALPYTSSYLHSHFLMALVALRSAH